MSDAKLSRFVFLTIGALILLSLVVAVNLNPTSDITWRMHVANATLSGKEIYRDLIETNPPLWFWASLIWAGIGKALGISAYVAMCVGIHAIAAIGVFLLDRLLRPTLPRNERFALLIGFVFSYLYVTIGEIGQREQGLMLGAMLWVALAALRIERVQVPIWLVICVSLFGAYGFALKHYFVAIPIVIEMWLFAHLKRDYRPIRLETVILGVLAIIYAMAVFQYAQLFLSRIVPLVSVSYDSFGATMGGGVQDRLTMIVLSGAFVIVPMIAIYSAKSKPRIIEGLFIVLMLTTLIMVLQFKGWRYHKLAAHGTAAMIVALAIGAALGVKGSRFTRDLRLGIFCAFCLTFVFVVNPLRSIIANNGQFVPPKLRALVTSEPSSKKIVILSTAPENAFYLLDRANRPQWSRHYSLWMLPGLSTVKADPKKEAQRQIELARVREEFVADVMCASPDLVVSEQGVVRVKETVQIDTLGYLRANRAFAAWFDTTYQSAETFEIYTVWRLKGPKPAPSRCERAP
jgi:hypothetical protein